RGGLPQSAVGAAEHEGIPVHSLTGPLNPADVSMIGLKRNASHCRGPIDRRTFMKIGGLSLGALAAGNPVPDLARLMAAESAAPGVDREFWVILLWAGGGPSHLETFDLKPQAPAEYRGPFQPIQTNVSGTEITELLPRLATMADKFTIVRSL